ncbi:SDR family oxidoreductase [SAR202 cluster bacterium AD-804-J14_MRT_500m]|nr:SDR family oxidoreductase [SAR202 cluster bacterium AD-804-J14_MRT_500m]
MRSVVTGGAGFIGSHVVDRLLSEGHEVVVLDNLVTGRTANLAEHSKNPKLTLCQTDISNLEDVKAIMDGVDWVFHLAGRADVVPSIEHPLDYHRSNVDGTINVLEAARLADVRRFIYTASSSCYGIPDLVPTPETAEIRPQYPYALTKSLGEQYALHWNQIYKLPVVSMRLFNVYGPRSRTSGVYGAVFGVFLAQKLNNLPFTVVGDGTQSRDFTFVSDVVEALILAAKSTLENEVLNVGQGSPSTINHLVELLQGKVVYVPKRPGEPDTTHADVSKIKRTLGWEPKVSFEDGVRVMMSNIENWREAPIWTPETIATATREWFKQLGPAGN